ncbi:hypothetical protein, partial [Listeria monocytogenes]|uniref:hypothetical protein n=1 Tax=Listeria monocytogenes TaxID=1639 RepID=UPI002FDC2C6F
MNERLIPWYDPTGRLFLQSDDPVLADEQFKMQRRNSAVAAGYMLADEARAEIGLPPMTPTMDHYDEEEFSDDPEDPEPA